MRVLIFSFKINIIGLKLVNFRIMKLRLGSLLLISLLAFSACSAEETDPLYMQTKEEAKEMLQTDYSEEERKEIYLERQVKLRSAADLPKEELAQFLIDLDKEYAEMLGGHNAITELGFEAMEKGWYAEVEK